MGGCAAALGSMASSAGSAIGSAASSVGSGIASGAQAVGEFGGGAVDFVSGAAKGGASWMGDNVVSPVMSSAKEAGADAFNGAKDFFSQGWENAKKDFGDKIDEVVVKDASGEVDGWKTAGNVAYQGGKALLASSFAGGGKRSTQPQEDQSHAQVPEQTTRNAEQTPSAEDELNKLRNKINA